jgi:hypothetical protein
MPSLERSRALSDPRHRDCLLITLRGGKVEYIGVNGQLNLNSLGPTNDTALEGGVTGFSKDKRYNVSWTLSAGYM